VDATANMYDIDPSRPGVGGRVVDPQVQEWERTYALFEHLSLLTFLVVIPILPLLALWLIKRDQSHFIDDHGKEAINFQISLLLYKAAAVVVTVLTCGVGFVLIPVIFLFGLIGMTMGAIAAHRSEYFRYPACIRFIH
jgi:uncharacterized Tic20 family protein